MKRLFGLAPLLILAACATAVPPPGLLPPPPPIQMPDQAHTAWVQYGPDGPEARAVTAGACPALVIDGKAVAMQLRAPASADFPAVCAAPVPKDSTSLSIDGRALPVPVAQPTHILVLGDTGCRIQGETAQACNDPRAWPFAGLSAAAVALKPDLILHLGDYLYRESSCPKGNAGCAGSPHGDNWQSWNADLFAPAAPLLAAAPIIFVRGNHEDCDRAGAGYLRLLGPDSWNGACNPHLLPYEVKLDGTAIAVLDDSAAPDTSIDQAGLPAYADDLAALGKFGPVWLALHRPIWGLISGPLNIPIGGNATMIAAAGSSLIPKDVALMLSGHIHTFEAINYDHGVPPQIVAGHGGDNLDATPSDLSGAIFQGHSGISVKDGISVHGFGFLMLTKAGRGWTIDLYDSAGGHERRCLFMPGEGGAFGRVDCPKA